jgi:hypothetical protein
VQPLPLVRARSLARLLARSRRSHSCSHGRAARTVARTVAPLAQLLARSRCSHSCSHGRAARTVARTVAPLAQTVARTVATRLPPYTQVACSWFKRRLARTVARTVALSACPAVRLRACHQKEAQTSKHPFIVHVTRVCRQNQLAKMQAAAVRQTSELCRAAAQHEKLVLTCRRQAA